MPTRISTGQSALTSLRRYTRPREEPHFCALCHAPIPEQHGHLFEIAGRQLHCACEPCSILFGNAAAPRFRRVPWRLERLDGLQISDLQWEALGLPIQMAFFVQSSAANRTVAYYPSPGGAIESALPPEAWADILREDTALSDLQPDVEALLVNRLARPPEQYVVGIDLAYKLTGLVRSHWQGFSGGDAVWREIDRFFAFLRAGSPSTGDRSHA